MAKMAIYSGGTKAQSFNIPKGKKFEEMVREIWAAVQEAKPADQAGTGGTVSVADEIKKFADLKEQGIITEDEFATKKKELLGA